MNASEREDDTSAPGPRRPRYAAKAAASLLVGGVFVFLLWRGALPVVPTRGQAFANVHWLYVALACVGWLAGHLLRAGRWYWLLAPARGISLRTVFRLSFAGFAVVVALPFRIGELARLLMIGKTTGLSPWAASGMVGAERIIDGLTLSVMLLSGLLIARQIDPLPDHIGALAVPARIVSRAAYFGLTVFACALIAMTLFHARREWARRTTESVFGLVSRDLGRKLADKVALVSDGLGFLDSARILVPFSAATISYWLANVAAVWFLSRATGLSTMGLAEAMVVLGTLALGVSIPAAPGYFGTFQLSVYAALALYHPPADVIEQGSVFVFLLYVLQVGAQLLIGGGAMLVGGGLRHRSPAPGARSG